MPEPARVEHLLVDARPVRHLLEPGCGIGRSVAGLLGGLTAIDAPFTALVSSDTERDLLTDVVDPARVVMLTPAAVADRSTPGTWFVATQLFLPPIALDPVPRAITAARLPVAAVIDDVISHRHTGQAHTVDRRLVQLRAPLAHTVDLMLAASGPTADSVAAELGFPRDRIAVIAAAEGATQRWTWPRVASEAIGAMGERGPRWPLAPRRPPAAVGLAGPFEGSVSGIGAYDVAVATALEEVTADMAEPDRPLLLHRLVDVSGSPEPTYGAAHRWSVRAVGRYLPPSDLDHLVAVLGSSHHHVATAELAVRVPTHVWLHEATLVGIHLGLAHLSGSPRWADDHVRSVVAACEGDAALARVSHALGDPDLLAADGVTLLRQTLDAARSVIVSSERAAAIVRSVRSDGPPVLVLPLAFPPPVPPPGPPSTRCIAAVGWLDANKAPDLAVETLAELIGTHGVGDARLTFVGSPAGTAADDVRRTARRLGVADRVEITGRVDDTAYDHQVSTARVGLQLRTEDRGEMSAAIGDLVAHGVPTVTNLQTAAPSSDGLRVVPTAATAGVLAAAMVDLLTDDTAWSSASRDALARATSWTFHDVARALLDWLDDVDGLAPDAIRRV